MYDGTEDPLP
jgi:hypothetical protein